VSVFTPEEIVYLQNQRLGRMATVGPDGQPHVIPVTFHLNLDPRREPGSGRTPAPWPELSRQG
jgi:hypothetical protein